MNLGDKVEISEHRPGRTYLELAIALKDDGQFYHALYSLELCERECLNDQDTSGPFRHLFSQGNHLSHPSPGDRNPPFSGYGGCRSGGRGAENRKEEILYKRIAGNILLGRYIQQLLKENYDEARAHRTLLLLIAAKYITK